jgi:hypothetical protein
MSARCFLCQPPALIDDGILEHLRLLHPQEFGDGPQRWPDGHMVVVDPTLEPSDFAGPAEIT